MPVTIKDIARKLKTSHVTVSKALRNQPPISLEMQKKVKQVAQEMGYQPNFLGRGLQGGRTQTLGILWSMCGPHPSMDLTRNLTLKAQHHGYISYVVDSLSDSGIFDRTLDDFARRGVDALVIEHEQPEEIMSRLAAFSAAVVVGPHTKSLNVDYVHYDRTPGIRESAHYLISKGRRRPAFVHCGQASFYKGMAFLTEFQNRGIELSPNASVEVMSHLTKDIPGLLEKQFPNGRFAVDSVFCQTDHIAIGVIKWLKSHGISVPGDVAVMGFNNSDFCECIDPPLASVDRNDEKLAEEIERLVFSRLDKPEIPPRCIDVPMTFVRRESAG